MKKNFFLITVMLFSVFMVRAQSFKIVGSITNVVNGEVCLLNYETETLIAEVMVTDGKFILKGTIDATTLGKVIFKDKGVSYENTFFIESGTTNITLNLDKENVYDGIGYAEIVALFGTPNNNILTAFSTTHKSFESLPEYKNLDKAREALTKFDNSGVYDPQARKIVYAKIGEASEPVIKLTMDAKAKIFKDTKGALGALYLIVSEGSGIENASFTMAQKKEFLKSANQEAKASIYYDILEKHVNRIVATEVGQPAPLFTLKNEKGEAITLKSLKGKYVLLDFWAYYCAPCIASFPKLNTLYKKYKENGFEIISISRDLDEAKWQNGLKKHQNPWIQLIDEAENGDDYQPLVSNKFSVQFMPTYILLDKKAEIILYTLEEKEVEDLLETIFN